MKQDNPAYLARKATFAKMLTIYGRKPVLEALSDANITAYKLHLAESNKPAPILSEMINLAEKRSVEVSYHSKEQLSRISKNSKQDQGVALDIHCQGFQSLDDFVKSMPTAFDLIAADNITNPQNLGMVIRSVCASPTTALLIPAQGCARLDALVIKASAGALFKANIIRCGDLKEALETLKLNGAKLFALAGGGTKNLRDLPVTGKNIYVLGNETHGVSQPLLNICHDKVGITMNNGVESLNVSIAASLVAFHRLYH